MCVLKRRCIKQESEIFSHCLPLFVSTIYVSLTCIHAIVSRCRCPYIGHTLFGSSSRPGTVSPLTGTGVHDASNAPFEISHLVSSRGHATLIRDD